MDNFIPFSKPAIGEEEIKAATDVLRSGWLTIGPKVAEFEELVKNKFNAKYAIAVDSCTSALTLSLKSLDSYRGDTAIIPALTFIATANAAYHAGFNIRFCDVSWDGNIDEYNIPTNSFVTVPVHFAGQVCNLEMIRPTSLHIIEDAAHAIGAIYEDKFVGTTPYSDGACFSFYPTKNMTTIEGGLILTNDEDLATTTKELSLHGLGTSHISRYEKRSSLHKPLLNFDPGYKANMTDVEAAIGIVQLKKLPYFILIRKRIAKFYTEELKDKVRMLDVNGRDHIWHMFVILVENRDQFVTKMKEKGIGVGIHYSPIIPAHPFYSKLTKYGYGDFPVAEYISEHCVSLPLYPSMTNEEMEKVVNTVKELV